MSLFQDQEQQEQQQERTSHGKEERIAEWKKTIQEFENQVLHPGYINLPIRSNIIQVAEEYNAVQPYCSTSPSSSSLSLLSTNHKPEEAPLQSNNNNNINNKSHDIGQRRRRIKRRCDDDGGGGDEKTLMPGSHKHLGGAYDPTDGCIYGVPANSKNVLVLYPRLITTTTTSETTTMSTSASSTTTTTAAAALQQLKLDSTKTYDPSLITYGMTSIPLPPSIASMKFKWLRGIFAHGYMYAIPAWANAILCVDVDAYWGRRRQPRRRRRNQEGNDDDNDNNNNQDENGIVTLIPLPKEYPQEENMQWQWHGAGMNQEKTAIYCIPSNAQKVLKVDLTTHTSSLIDIDVNIERYPNFRLDLHNKWYGGILGRDNAVYGVPYRSCAVLRIDCISNTATLVGPDYGLAGYNWHGGIMVHGKIYAHPSHADYTVLVIDTNPQKTCNHNNGNKNESEGGGHCYELAIDEGRRPSDTETTTTTTTTTTAIDSPIRNRYKWLGGTLGADGNIYCPACDTTAVLKIDVTNDTCQTFGFTGHDKNKWQGGVLGNDGCIYCIPASGKHVLRIGTNTKTTTTITTNNNNCTDDNSARTTQQQQQPPLQLLGLLPERKDKWQGGYVGLDGNLYFIPENGYRVLKVVTPQIPPILDDHGQLPHGDVTLEFM